MTALRQRKAKPATEAEKLRRLFEMLKLEQERVDDRSVRVRYMTEQHLIQHEGSRR
jgi:hypothetical protein